MNIIENVTFLPQSEKTERILRFVAALNNCGKCPTKYEVQALVYLAQEAGHNMGFTDYRIGSLNRPYSADLDLELRWLTARGDITFERTEKT